MPSGALRLAAGALHGSMYSDSDSTRCPRKSTSGGALMRGAHVIKTWSTTQATVARPSAGAEGVAIVRAAAERLAVASLPRGMRQAGAVQIRAGSSAAQHMQTHWFWQSAPLEHPPAMG